MAGKPGMKGGGGARPGAGRKPGGKNPRTIARNEAARLLPHCADPLEWLLNLMTDDRQDLRLRAAAGAGYMMATRYKTMYWWLHSGYTD